MNSTDPYTPPSQYYSSPKPNDYYSTSTPTTVQKLSYNSSDYYYYYSTPSLYTKEDQMNILRRKEKLKNDISQLRLKYKQLKSELKQIKKEKVSEGEMTFLQAETKEESSKNNFIQIQNLLKDLFEQIQSAAAAKAFVTVFDQKLKEEEKQRKYICDELNAISNLFDFSEYQLKMPQVKQINKDLQNSLREKYGDEVRRLEKMNKEIRILSCPEQLSSTQVDAANSVAKLTNLQCKLSTVGLQMLKADVNHLQKFCEEQEFSLRKSSIDVEYVRKKLKSIEIQGEQEESSRNAQLLSKKATYQQQLDSNDKEIDEIKNRIDETAFQYDEIMKSIDHLIEQKNSLQNQDDSKESLINEDFLIKIEEEEEELSDEEEDIFQIDQSEINSLTEKEILLKNEKQNLMNDVSKLQFQLKTTKNRLSAKENKKKLKIKKLFSKYSENKKIIMQEQKIINDSSSSNIHDEITNVLSHIDESISQLKNGFSEI